MSTGDGRTGVLPPNVRISLPPACDAWRAHLDGRIPKSRQSGRTTIAAHIACRLAPGRLRPPGLLGLRPSAHSSCRVHPSPLADRPCGPGGNPPGRNCSGAVSAPPSRWSGAGVDAVGDMWPTTDCRARVAHNAITKCGTQYPLGLAASRCGRPGDAAALPGDVL